MRNPSKSPGGRGAAVRAVLVWDVPTRLFHWLLVALLVTSWITGKTGGDALRYHFWSGYAILTLVLFRIVWGLIGGTHARFTTFVRGIPTALHHVREVFSRGPTSDVGHNAIGGWMIVVLLMALLVQTGSGLFADDDIVTTGPLGDLVSSSTRSRLTTIHKYNFELILILAGIHILAVFTYLVFKRQNLIGAMITGRKHGLAASTLDATQTHPAIAAAVLLGAAAVVAGIVNLGPYLAR
jgi:cytochrome b